MKLLFRTTVILFILFAAQLVSGQEKVTMYSKSFDVNKNTTLLIELNNTIIDISESSDDQVHVEYSYDFFNQSKREKNKIQDLYNKRFKIKDTILNNLIKLYSTQKRFEAYGAYQNTMISKTDTFNNARKTVNDLENEKQKILSYNSYEELINKQNKNNPERREKLLKKHKENRKKRNTKRNFAIQIPKGVNVDIIGSGTTLKFNGVIKNKLNIRLKNGRLFADQLINDSNLFNLEATHTFITAIDGGKMVFDTVTYSLLGTVSNVKIESSYSNIDIGQIKGTNEITDFSGTYILYNNQKKNAQLAMKTEYSKVHYFKPIDESKFTVYGNDIKIVNNSDKYLFKSNTSRDHPIAYENKGNSLKSNEIQMSFGIFYIQE